MSLIAADHSDRTEHVVQLFDDDASLARTVAAFLDDGFQTGDTALAVTTPHHWERIGKQLDANGVQVNAFVQSGRLTVCDARATLEQFMRNERPNAAMFDNAVGGLVRRLRARGRPLRIYGEMVDVLAAEGLYTSAQELEELWNVLGTRETFHLFCGYSATNFGNPRTAVALRAICGAHSRVAACAAEDILSAYLMGAHVGCLASSSA